MRLQGLGVESQLPEPVNFIPLNSTQIRASLEVLKTSLVFMPNKSVVKEQPSVWCAQFVIDFLEGKLNSGKNQSGS